MHGATQKVDLGMELLEKACINGEEPKACINLEKVFRARQTREDQKKADMYREMSERILQYQDELVRRNASPQSE